MQTKDLLVVGAWALGTVAILTAVAPVTLDAKSGSGVAVTPVIEKPTLKVNGCELSLDWPEPPAKDGMEAGSMPVVKLVMLNPGKELADCPWVVHMLVTPATSPMSRTILMPKETWSEKDEYSLLPGERKEITLRPGKALAAGERAQFTIESKGQSINALGTFVKPKVQPQKLAAVKPSAPAPGGE